MRNIKINIAKFFVFVAAIQILNLCIDTQFLTPLQSKHTVGYENEINSFVEYFAEVVFDHKNALPEYQKSSHESQQNHKHGIASHLSIPEKRYILCAIRESDIIHNSMPKTYEYLFYKEITPPPPKHNRA